MKAKALSMFRTQLRDGDTDTVLVHFGDIIDCGEERLRDLARNRLVELIEEDEPAAKKTAATKTDPAKSEKAKTGNDAKAAAKPAKGEATGDNAPTTAQAEASAQAASEIGNAEGKK